MSEPTWNRRTFLKAAAACGVAATVPAWLRMGRGRAQEGTYAGPYWVFATANGAWDPQFMFDPTLDPTYNRLYSEIGQAGAISYAQIPVDPERMNLDVAAGEDLLLMTAEAFLTKYGSQLTVINGIDTSTNNHDGGRRAMGSGRLPIGYPALGALIAAARAPDLPMAFLSGGGYDFADNLVPLTRVTNADALARVARPNMIDATNPESELFHTSDTMRRIQRMQTERARAQRDRQRLPALRDSVQALLDARVRTSDLDRLQLPEQLVDVALGDLESMMRQSQLAVAAFKSGLTACAGVSLGGFDTHGNHDRDQSRKALTFLAGIDFLMEEAKREGLEGNLIVVATSDFGRGPHYNGESDGSGKDHWPVTSMFAMGTGIAGDRVVGGTDDQQLARGLDPASLAVDDAGITLTPEHVHLALRRLAGIDTHELAERYPLPGEVLPLFG